MAEFDETKLQVDRVPWSETNVAVRYDGHYCGAVQKVSEGEYSCAVSMERDGEMILQAFGRSSSIETGARRGRTVASCSFTRASRIIALNQTKRLLVALL
jgi:hypothetical protein